MPAIEATGWTRFVDLFGGDMDAVRDVATVFLEESEHQGDAVQDALDQDDADALRRVAHSLQSTARQIGAKELATVSSRLESAGRAGDMQSAREAAPEFFRLLQATRAELRDRLG